MYACGVDAVQVLLGCTYGKSNLITRIRGKMAFSFFSRDTGKSVRLVLKHGCGAGMERAERFLGISLASEKDIQGQHAHQTGG